MYFFSDQVWWFSRRIPAIVPRRAEGRPPLTRSSLQGAPVSKPNVKCLVTREPSRKWVWSAARNHTKGGTRTKIFCIGTKVDWDGNPGLWNKIEKLWVCECPRGVQRNTSEMDAIANLISNGCERPWEASAYFCFFFVTWRGSLFLPHLFRCNLEMGPRDWSGFIFYFKLYLFIHYSCVFVWCNAIFSMSRVWNCYVCFLLRNWLSGHGQVYVPGEGLGLLAFSAPFVRPDSF